MAFVVEKIPETAKVKFPYINTKLTDEWAIDHDRDAFIVITEKYGGPYEGTPITKFYTLNWREELIKIAASPLPKTYLEQGVVMNWRVHRLIIPPALAGRRDEVLQLIRDAFSAIGQAFDGDRFLSVNVEFDLPQNK